jgi:hypothetical protein
VACNFETLRATKAKPKTDWLDTGTKPGSFLAYFPYFEKKIKSAYDIT